MWVLTETLMVLYADISIGFEKAEYTFSETDETVTGTVVLVKNRPTEQTFDVTVEVVELPFGKSARVGKDFILDLDDHTNTIKTISFMPGQQRMYIHFQILADGIPENTETFRLVLSKMGTLGKDTTRYSCDPTQGCLSSTTIVLKDNPTGGKLLHTRHLYIQLCYVFVQQLFKESDYNYRSDCWIREQPS